MLIQKNKVKMGYTAATLIGVTLVLIGLCLTIGCRESNSPESSDSDMGLIQRAAPKLSNAVYAINYPLYFITSRIAGDALDVHNAIPQGADPDTWRPSADAVGAMQRADLIVIDGGGIQSTKWLQQVSLPTSRLCRTVEAFGTDDLIVIDDYEVHSHGPEGEHTHSGIVPSVWLDPLMLKKQAAFITDQLVATYPEREETFRNNLKQLAKDLDELATQLESLTLQAEQTAVYSSSPELKYLARRAGLEDIHFHWSNREGKPDESSWEELDEVMKNDAAKLMLWTEPPMDSTAENLRRRSVDVIVVDPLRRAPAQGDYISVMQANIKRLDEALSSR